MRDQIERDLGLSLKEVDLRADEEVANVIDQKAEVRTNGIKGSHVIRRAELHGAMSREEGDARDSNPYLDHRRPPIGRIRHAMREMALQRYPNAKAVSGTVEVRNLSDSDDEKPFPVLK